LGKIFLLVEKLFCPIKKVPALEAQMGLDHEVKITPSQTFSPLFLPQRSNMLAKRVVLSGSVPPFAKQNRRLQAGETGILTCVYSSRQKKVPLPAR
jgi:hypothetical protein